MNYKELQYMRVEDLILNKPWIFNGDSGNGEFRGKHRQFVLQDSKNNLYSEILNECLEYFEENEISWWGGKLPNHTLSSQIACLNHLFMYRNDKDAILSIIKAIDHEAIEVLPISSDKQPTYVQFEAVSYRNHLKEDCVTRGSNCTSVDALIYSIRENGKKVIYPIEWKYTESYGNDDKAKGDKGEKRTGRYRDLIEVSSQLCAENHAVYYYEPFYQLMRQTLWAEQMIANKLVETIKADDYIHIHVIPKQNGNLLEKKYLCSHKKMEETWRSCINDQKKYCIIEPEELLKPLANFSEYEGLLRYLKYRYWK